MGTKCIEACRMPTASNKMPTAASQDDFEIATTSCLSERDCLGNLEPREAFAYSLPSHGFKTQLLFVIKCVKAAFFDWPFDPQCWNAVEPHAQREAQAVACTLDSVLRRLSQDMTSRRNLDSNKSRSSVGCAFSDV